MKKSKLILSFISLITLVLVIVGCSGSVSAAEAYVTVDINPSIELVVNNRDKVVYVNALNDDAEVLLADLELAGLNVDDAMDIIIEAAIELGYIDVDAEETYVSVSTTSDNEVGEQIKERVKEAINNAFANRVMKGKAQNKSFTPEFIAEAEGYGVTPEFLFLAYSVTYVDDEITLEDALLMEQSDLMDILVEAKQAAKDLAQSYREEFIAAREEIRNTYQPQIEDLEGQIATIEAQIEAVGEDVDTTELEADLAALVDQLHTVHDQMKAEIDALRATFRQQTETLREEGHQTRDQLKQMYKDKIQNWRTNIDNRRSEMEDEIENFQKGKDKE